MLSSLYNILNFSRAGNSSQEESNPEANYNQINSESDLSDVDIVDDTCHPEIKSKIFGKAKNFMKYEKIDDIEISISDKALSKFLKAIKRILKLYNKDYCQKNILEFIDYNTTFMYYGTKHHLASNILENGWNTKDRLVPLVYANKKNSDIFTNRVDTSHQYVGKDSVVLFAMTIVPCVTDKYTNICKEFTDSPFYLKWNCFVDNTNTENYSLGLCVASTKHDPSKNYLHFHNTKEE
jgi:hypothetical protein